MIFLFLQCVSTVIIVYIIISPLNSYLYIHWILDFINKYYYYYICNLRVIHINVDSCTIGLEGKLLVVKLYFFLSICQVSSVLGLRKNHSDVISSLFMVNYVSKFKLWPMQNCQSVENELLMLY